MNGHFAISTATTTSYTTAPTASPTSIKTSTIRPPLTEVSPTNQTGVIAILTGFSLGLLLLSILVRLYARRNARLQRCDCAFYLAVVFGLAGVSTTAWLISIGLGKNIDMLDEVVMRVVERGALATRILYLLTLWLSKVSCALMFVWLTPFDKQRRAAWGLIALSTIGIISSLFLEGFECHDLLGQCHGFRGRWVYISVLDMVLEVLLVGASLYMVWGRSMSTRAKVTVVGAFACRLPNVALTLTHLLFLLLPAPTTAIHTSRIHATTQLAIGYTIVSCVIPYLRPLMQSYESDGTGHGRTDATFDLSDRSRESKGSPDLKGLGYGEPGGKRKARAVELNDVSRLLGPERPAFVRLKSAEAVERAGRQTV